MNEVGHESANELMCEGRDLPWLQDVAEHHVWDTWEHVYRDVIIVDAEGHIVDVFNLTQNNLANTDNFQALKSLLLDVATE